MGTDEELRELVQDAAQREECSIVIDGVFNHCSWYFLAVSAMWWKKERSSRILPTGFIELQFPVIRPADPEEEKPSYTVAFAYERKMPKLNTAEPEEMQLYFAEVRRLLDPGI